jgi:nitroimidazol reductase NimA-like FMN-containing flavoprotein (pyridoxamine 5'-phosphate oxidase superfamily)
MPPLTKAQIDALLAGPINARLATVKSDGAPYVVPVWQYWDGMSMYVIPREKSRFVTHIKHDARVAISCANDVDPAHYRVLLEGNIEIVAGPVRMEGRMLEIATEMAQRYGGEAGLAYLRGTLDKPRYLLKLTPSKMTTWSGPWHPRYG